MKIKKLLAGILACACVIPAGVFAACGGGDGEEEDVNPPGVTTYIFEAEGVDLSEQSGRGWSNEAAGCKMIQGQNVAKIRNNASVLKSISNGYFVGFFGTEGTELVFEINAAEAENDVPLVLRLASEWGTMTVDSSVMTVEVNGENVAYNGFELTGKKIESAASVEYGVPFKDFTLSAKVNLVKGANTVKIIAQGKKHPEAESLRIGPGVDCIKLKSKTALTWESLWDENKDNIAVEP